MNDLTQEIHEQIGILTIERENKRNAFDDVLIAALIQGYQELIQQKSVRVILLKGQGAHFSAGADIEWMKRMAQFNFEDNVRDARLLAELMHTIYHCPKPTIAMVQGCTYGGGVGLVAASDIGIASHTARFCFSETQLGLIPAVISPFVVKAIGVRAAKALFMSAEVFDATRALALNLIHHSVDEADLLNFSLEFSKKLAQNAPEAVLAAKQLVDKVSNNPIDNELADYTAELIAKKRVSVEGQKGLSAFLNKEKPNWN